MIQAHNSGEGRFVVSDNGVWVPGVYDSYATAKLAAQQLKDSEIVRWLGPIYTCEGLDRPVSGTDLLLAIQAVREMREKNL